MIEKTVLLAEDDPSHEALLRRVVSASSIPCRLDVVHDGIEVIEYLFATGRFADRDAKQIPNLILLDLKMPRMDGLQVLQVLRRVRGGDYTRFAPVVVLTSSESDQDIVEAYRLGAQSYICKPLDFPAFSSAVTETLQYWLGLNAPAPQHHLGAYAAHEGL
ncbi:MAG: response regulator [Pirellulales bacterium]|nr:response regulator [Pirellulales bacterium]